MAYKKKNYTVDGSRFSTLAEAAVEFTQALGLTTPWNGNLDAFNDILHGGFGTPEEGFVLTWQHANISRQKLGYAETLLWLKKCLSHCHPSNVPDIQNRILAASRQEGKTLFDILVSIIEDHKDIELRLS